MEESNTGMKVNQAFKQRAISTIIAIPIVMAMIWFGAPWFTILVAGWGAGSVWEFYGLVKRAKGLSPLTYFGLLWTLLFIISPHFSQVPHFKNVPVTSLLLTTTVILPLIYLLWRKGKENAFGNWAWTAAGILYIGWILSYIVALRNLDDGRGWVFLAILCSFASDISAYLVGRTFGKHKMAPYISPKKSWEGAVAGVLGSIILSEAVVYFFHLPLDYGMAVVLGVLISVIGQLGDLIKSLFKRSMEVKDSGNVLPGHGGFLDRIDSLLLAGMLVYYFAAFIS
jgi:phosphatidate cytidylyltransferase